MQFRQSAFDHRATDHRSIWFECAQVLCEHGFLIVGMVEFEAGNQQIELVFFGHEGVIIFHRDNFGLEDLILVGFGFMQIQVVHNGDMRFGFWLVWITAMSLLDWLELGMMLCQVIDHYGLVKSVDANIFEGSLDI